MGRVRGKCPTRGKTLITVDEDTAEQVKDSSGKIRCPSCRDGFHWIESLEWVAAV